MGWGVIITGLVTLFMYPPIGVILLIMGFTKLAFHARKKALSRTDEQKGMGHWKKGPKCVESVKKERAAVEL